MTLVPPGFSSNVKVMVLKVTFLPPTWKKLPPLPQLAPLPLLPDVRSGNPRLMLELEPHHRVHEETPLERRGL